MTNWEPSRLRGSIIAGAGIALFLTEFVLSLIPGPTTQGVPSYPYFDGRAWGLFVETMTVLSAGLVAIALSDLTRHAVLVVLTLGIVAFLVGAALFVFTLFHGIPVTSTGGTVYVQSFPQSLLVIVWGFFELLFLPVVFKLRKQAGKPTGTPTLGQDLPYRPP